MTHVGDPRAHCQEGVRHCARADRATGLAGLAVVHAEDEEVGDTGVLGYICEGVLDPVSVAEAAPEVEDVAAGMDGFVDAALSGEVQRSAESILEMLLALG